MLNIVDYARFMEKIRTHMPPIINPPSSSSYCSNSYTSTSTTSTSFESSFLHSNFNPKHCDIDKFLITSKDNEEIVKMAENTEGSKRLQQKAFEDKQFRQKIIDMLLCSDKILAHLAMDNNANFLIQKLVELEMDNSMPGPLVQSIKKMSLDLALNRYGCRVIQKLFNYLPSKNVQDLLSEQFKGHEFQLITDQNGNHIIQFVVNHFHPEVYAAFMQSLIDSIGIQQIIENKYGCRVVQAALERVISECQKDHEQYLEKTTAKELLRILIFPIIQNAYDFAKNEFANYIVQVILKSDYLSEQRRHIIKESLMHNLFILSQGKFSSHVVEVALEHADDNCLEAMFLEILEGYEPDGSGRTALDFMLFNQFGNYVVQRMLEISVDIRDGKRKGNQKWMDEIISRALFVQHQLSRYSSGKKILDMIQVHVLPHHQFIVPNPYLPNAFRHEPFIQPQPNPMGWNLGMIAANPPQQFYFPPNPFFY